MSRLDDSYALAVKTIRARVSQYAEARFRAGALRDADAERFIREVVPVILAGRRQVSALTDGYLAAQMSRMLGHRVPPAGAIPTDGIRGVDPAVVYQRPFVTARMGLAAGATPEEATTQGVGRLISLVVTDMQLAKTLTARSTMGSVQGVGSYVRVLSGSENCGLCVVASTQRYAKSDLMPIHPGCDCGVRPILAGDRIRMTADLTAAHTAVEDRFGVSDSGARTPDYRKMLLVREHGELGPILTVKSHSFTGPGDLSAA